MATKTTQPKPLPSPITAEVLVQCGASKTHAGRYVEFLNELLPYYGITTLLRLAHFLAQVLHESDRMRAVEEYASGAAYEGRDDLGNTHPGDGVRFKGRGLFQTTGRGNYTSFAKTFGIDCVNNPELLEQPKWALVSALYYWNSRKLNAPADADDGVKVTKKINGGTNGLKDRLALVVRCKEVLSKTLFT